ncbi:MAG: hypothetical protein ACOX62_07130 [Christensenellales bacterium]|jgi:hypothetical protein
MKARMKAPKPRNESPEMKAAFCLQYHVIDGILFYGAFYLVSAQHIQEDSHELSGRKNQWKPV